MTHPKLKIIKPEEQECEVLAVNKNDLVSFVSFNSSFLPQNTTGALSRRGCGALTNKGIYLPTPTDNYEWQIVIDDMGARVLILAKNLK